MGTTSDRFRDVYWSLGPEYTEWWMALVCIIPGRIGMALRARVYGKRLKSCGRNPVFQQHVVLIRPELISVGDRVLVNRHVQLQGGGGITIGNCVMIGPGVMIWSINHGSSDTTRPMIDQEYVRAPVVIEDDVWIGAGAIVCPGSHIGRGAIIGAGSVVRGTIPPGVLAAGVPAVVKRERRQEAERGQTPP